MSVAKKSENINTCKVFQLYWKFKINIKPLMIKINSTAFHLKIDIPIDEKAFMIFSSILFHFLPYHKL